MLSLPVLAAGPVPNGDGRVDTGLRAVLPPPAAGASAGVVPCCRAAASTPLSAAGGAAVTPASAASSVIRSAAKACANFNFLVVRIRCYCRQECFFLKTTRKNSAKRSIIIFFCGFGCFF